VEFGGQWVCSALRGWGLRWICTLLGHAPAGQSEDWPPKHTVTPQGRAELGSDPGGSAVTVWQLQGLFIHLAGRHPLLPVI